MKRIKSLRRWRWVVTALAVVLLLGFARTAFAQGGDPVDPQAVASKADDAVVSLNVMWVMLAGFLVFFMQAGFALVETGFTRAKNVAHTMMMNLMVFCIGAVGYWLTGFAFQFGAVNAAYPDTTFTASGGTGPYDLTWSVSLFIETTINGLGNIEDGLNIRRISHLKYGQIRHTS